MSGVFKKLFNAVVRGSTPDKGFLRDFSIGVLSVRLASDFSVLTSATNPSVQVTGSVPRLQWATGNLAAVAFQHSVGRELANASANTARTGGPTIRLRGLIRTNGNTDTPTWTVTCFARTGVFVYNADGTVARSPGVLKAVHTAANVVGTKNLTNPELVSWEFTLVQNATPFYLEAGDTLTFVITPSGAHATDVYELHSLWLEAACNLTFTDMTLRAVGDN